MKFYIYFFLLTKWKGKKGLMRDKVKIEKVEMKVIKWEPEMTIEKKKNEERERERDFIQTKSNFHSWPIKLKGGF